MGILFRHTVRSIRDNLGQLVVILLTITVVSALFFVSLTIGGLFNNLQTSLKSRLGKDTDVTVSGGVFSESQLNEVLDNYDVDYYESYLQTLGLFRPNDNSESKVILIEATDFKKFAAKHSSELIICDSDEVSHGTPEVWVGKSFAEENGIKAGDKVQIYAESYDEYLILTVSYVFDNYGIFANNVINNVIVDFSTVGNYGLIDVANIKLNDPSQKDSLMAALNEAFPNAKVAESVDYAEVERIVGNNQRLLNVALVFVTALIIFILFTSYLVVAKKRVGELAVFRAAGASKSMIAAALIIEGLLYGFIGGLTGAMLGRIGMGIAVDKVIPNFPDAVKYTFGDFVFATLFGALVSALSALVPVIRASRESVRRAGTSVRPVTKVMKIPLIISAAVLAVSAVLTAVFSGKIYLILILVVSAAVFIYFFIPAVIFLLSSLFKSIRFTRTSGISVRRNPQGHTLSALVGLVIVFTFLIVGIVNVIAGAITPKNARFSADYVVENVEKDINSLDTKIASVYGVTSSYLYYYDTFVGVTDTQTGDYKEYSDRTYTVYCVEDGEALSGVCTDLDESVKDTFDTSLNPVVVGYDLIKRLGLHVGEEIKLKRADGQELYDIYTIVGVDYTVTADDRVMMIRTSTYRVDGKDALPNDSFILVSTSKDVPNADLYKDLRDRVESYGGYILTFDDWAYATSVGIKGVVTLLRILQFLVCGVALVGVVNLTVVTLRERKREFEVFFAVGMGKKEYMKTVIFESLIIAVSGAFVGIGLSLVINLLLPTFAAIIDRFVIFAPFPWELGAIALVAVLAYVIVYVVSAAVAKKNRSVERNVL